MRVAAETGGEATVVSMGPESALKTVWMSPAFGVDCGVLVSDEALGEADSLVTARVLALAIARRPYELVIDGVESTDGATARRRRCR